MSLSALNIRDLRPQLSVRPNPAGYRPSRVPRGGPPTSGTLHYNGPPVSVFGNAAAELQHVINIVPYHQARIGHDSLAYHAVVLSDGTIWQTRDWGLQCWHCANSMGNRLSIAVHLPVGGTQQPTAPQWLAFTALADAMCREWNFDRLHWYGHCEWPYDSGRAALAHDHYYSAPGQSACPGSVLWWMLDRWRRTGAGAEPATGYQVWQIAYDDSNIRQRPAVRDYLGAVPIAGVLKRGQHIQVDAIKHGQIIGANGGQWLHMARVVDAGGTVVQWDAGFVSADLARRVA